MLPTNFARTQLTKHWIQFLSLLLVMLLGLGLRLINLEALRLTHDEMSIGYNAWSLVQTGADEWAKPWPGVFRAFGDYKLPGYIYASLLPVAVLGMNPSSIKIVSLIAGCVIILAGYGLTRQLLNRHLAGLSTALILAISPWPIHLSRMALEAHLALALFLTGLWIAGQGLHKINFKKSSWTQLALYAVPAAILFGATFYTYIAYRLFMVSLLLTGLAVVWWTNRAATKYWLLLGVTTVLVISPLLPGILGEAGTARFSQVSIFTDTGPAQQVMDRRNFCFLYEPQWLPKICRVIYNRPAVIAERFMGNYLTALSPEFLFNKLGNDFYLLPPDYGPFVLGLLPIYVLGWLQVFKKKISRHRSVFLLALLLAPIPSALVGSPQLIRSSLLMPFITIVLGLGTFHLLNWLLRKPSLPSWLSTGVITTAVGVFTLQFFINYWFIYPYQYQTNFYLLSPQLSQQLVEMARQDEEARFYVTNDFADSHISLAFYGQIDPVEYQGSVVRVTPDAYGFWHPRQLGQFEFGPRNFNQVLCEQSVDYYVTAGSELVEFEEKLLGQSTNDELIILDKGYSGVHTQAKLYDLQAWSEELKAAQIYDQVCRKPAS